MNDDKNTVTAMLAHAVYSFSEIDWDFEQLTIREKVLIKNQATLDKIKKMAEDKQILSKL